MRRLPLVAALLLAVVPFPTACQSSRDVTPPADARYVASSRGSVYYPVACDAWRDLARRNLLFFASAGQAEARGLEPTTNRSCREAAPLRREEVAGGAVDVCVVARVLDGDTLDCEGGARIRLLLVDAPESGQADFGLRSKLALEELLPPGSAARVELDVQERDRYGRVLAHLHAPDGTWVNRALVRRGYAVTLVYPPNVRGVEAVRAAADSARVEGRGLWGEGAFRCLPVDFRAGRCGGG